MTQKYDLHKSGVYISTLTLVQVCRMLTESKDIVLQHVASGEPIGAYMIEKAQTAESENGKKKVLEEWDSIRFRLNPAARR